MGEPIAVFQGEKFRQVKIFEDRVSLSGETGSIDLPISEVGCLNGNPCQDTECRYYAPLHLIDNCILNVDREYTLEEIGQLLGGISRERVRQLVEGYKEGVYGHRATGALDRFSKRFRNATHATSLSDCLPDPPIPIRHMKRHKRVSK